MGLTTRALEIRELTAAPVRETQQQKGTSERVEGQELNLPLLGLRYWGPHVQNTGRFVVTKGNGKKISVLQF